jgi:hydrophobic/amphiphilic exporter-1 (mainly G- bacteria), HAE1 family
MNITEISIRRPSLIVVLFSLFTLFGIIGFMNLSYELMPDFDQQVITIKTQYPGADPAEVETSVSRIIEDALSNLEGVDYITTKSLPNASIVIVNLVHGTDLGTSMQDAQRYINNILKDLPDAVEPPEMSSISPNDLPMLSISASSSLQDLDFYQLMQDELIPQLQQTKGVAEITLLGGIKREIQVLLNPEKLALYNLSIVQVNEALIRGGLDLPAGSVQTNELRTSVRLIGKYETLSDIKNVLLAMPRPGEPIYLGDVAIVVDGIAEQSSVSRFNGTEGIGLLIKKQRDANSVDVAKAIRVKLSEIEQRYSKANLTFIIADDTTLNTIAAVNSVVYDLILAVILVSAVMLLFLHSYRNSLIVVVAIPTSLITAFAVMWLLNFTLNLMTLLAMSLIVGILVDDATVVLENIQRHLDMKKNRAEAALQGRMEIGFSAVSITLVDVVVFLPILFLQVSVADMLQQFSVVVITSTLTSLLVGFTLTPWMASRIGKSEDLQPTNIMNRFLLWFEHLIDRFTEWYSKQLVWVLHHKIITFTGILILFGLTGALMKAGIIGQELIATGDQGKFRMNLEYDSFATLQENSIRSNQIEQFLLQQPEVATVFSNVGGPSSGMGSLGIGSPYKTELTVQLKPAEERGFIESEQFMKAIRTALYQEFSGVRISMATLGLVPRSTPIELTLSGSDALALVKTSQELKSALQHIPGADNVTISTENTNPELQIIPDRKKMQQLGLNTALVGITLRTAITGNDDAILSENGVEYPVRLWVDPAFRENAQQLANFTFVNAKGLPVQLNQFAEVSRGSSPSLLERRDRQTSITITSDALGRPSGTVAGELTSWLKSNPLADGIQLDWGSDIKRQNDSFSALGSVLVISFLLIYLIMVALYDSYIYPFVVLFSIPVAIIGALLALNLNISNLSVFTLLGLIMLMGLVAKNAILIVDFTNQRKAEGLHYMDALVEAGKTRMRPILMTTISMIIGMLPIALASGTASEWKNGLAWVIIGGLTSSLMLTVYLVPIVYATVDSIKLKFKR